MNKDVLKANAVINLGDSDPTETLGLLWDPQTNWLVFPVEGRVTKRSLFNSLAQIFDPGLLSPLILTPKVTLQKLWKLHLNWDESVLIDRYTKWLSFKNDVS